MSPLNENEIKQAKKIVSMSKMAQILENIRGVIARDRQQKQPLILRINEGFIFNVARKAIEEKNSTFLMSIAGESASGKTTLANQLAANYDCNITSYSEHLKSLENLYKK